MQAGFSSQADFESAALPDMVLKHADNPSLQNNSLIPSGEGNPAQMLSERSGSEDLGESSNAGIGS